MATRFHVRYSLAIIVSVIMIFFGLSSKQKAMRVEELLKNTTKHLTYQSMLLENASRILIEQEQVMKSVLKDLQMMKEQDRRRRVIRNVCSKYMDFRTEGVFNAKDSRFYHKMGNSFLIDPSSKTVYCFNYKAAASSWMSLFTTLYHDKELTRPIIESGMYYEMRNVMGPDSHPDFAQRVRSGEYFSFTVVRHPLDRLLSAFRDRILNGCEAEAKMFIPRIFNKFQMHEGINIFDESMCVQVFPDFTLFLQFLVSESDDSNLHWYPYYKNCSPCLFEYDAVVKCETSSEDQEYVMRHLTLNNQTSLEFKHLTKGGKSEDVREQYFSQVPCDLLKQVHDLYALDFELFEYTLEPFSSICAR